MLSTLIKVKVHRWLPRGYPHAQILKHPGYALHSALRKYTGSRTLQNKSQAQKYVRYGTSSRACGKGRGCALEPRPVQRGPNQAGARARKRGRRRVPAPDGLPVRSRPRHARAPKLSEEGAGPAGAGSTGRGRGTRDSRAQGDRCGLQVVC